MSEIVVNEAWIMDQLVGIRRMEKELSVKLEHCPANSSAIGTEVARLNAWVSLVDLALSVRDDFAA